MRSQEGAPLLAAAYGGAIRDMEKLVGDTGLWEYEKLSFCSACEMCRKNVMQRSGWRGLDSQERSGIFHFTKPNLELNPGGILLTGNLSGQEKHSLVPLRFVTGALVALWNLAGLAGWGQSGDRSCLSQWSGLWSWASGRSVNEKGWNRCPLGPQPFALGEVRSRAG